MKIKTAFISQITLYVFADQHDLTLEIHERRRPVGDSGRYYAHFANCEAREGESCLIGLFGDGRTPEEAIQDYTRRISLRTLIIDAMKSTRREIEVPRLI